MPWKPKVKVTLIKCKKCKRSYSNPLTHVCKVKFSQAGAKRAKKSGW